MEGRSGKCPELMQPGVLRRVSARGYCCVLAVAMLVSVPVPAALSPRILSICSRPRGVRGRACVPVAA